MDNVRGSLAAVALDNKLYAMGGGQPNVNRDTTEVYEAQRNQWLPGPTMNHRRFTTAATLHNNSIFVSGGYDGTQYLRSVERLDPREGKWQLVSFVSSFCIVMFKRKCVCMAAARQQHSSCSCCTYTAWFRVLAVEILVIDASCLWLLMAAEGKLCSCTALGSFSRLYLACLVRPFLL